VSHTKEQLIELASKETFGEKYLRDRDGNRCVLGWLLELAGIHPSRIEMSTSHIQHDSSVGPIYLEDVLELSVSEIEDLWERNDYSASEDRTSRVIEALRYSLPTNYLLQDCREDLKKKHEYPSVSEAMDL